VILTATQSVVISALTLGLVLRMVYNL